MRNNSNFIYLSHRFVKLFIQIIIFMLTPRQKYYYVIKMSEGETLFTKWGGGEGRV